MSRRPLLRPFFVWLLAGPAMAVAVFSAALLGLLRGDKRRGFWMAAPAYIRLMAWAFGIRRKLEGWDALP